jgi:pantothenate kinase
MKEALGVEVIREDEMECLIIGTFHFGLAINEN